MHDRRLRGRRFDDIVAEALKSRPAISSIGRYIEGLRPISAFDESFEEKKTSRRTAGIPHSSCAHGPCRLPPCSLFRHLSGVNREGTDDLKGVTVKEENSRIMGGSKSEQTNKGGVTCTAPVIYPPCQLSESFPWTQSRFLEQFYTNLVELDVTN